MIFVLITNSQSVLLCMYYVHVLHFLLFIFYTSPGICVFILLCVAR